MNENEIVKKYLEEIKRIKDNEEIDDIDRERQLRVQRNLLKDELISLLQNQHFEGTKGEIAIQQVLFLDQYIKDNIDYDFETYNNSKKLKKELENNSISKERKEEIFRELNNMDGFRVEGFFKGKALCGSIGIVINDSLNTLWKRTGMSDICKCNIVYGGFQAEGNHMLNSLTIKDNEDDEKGHTFMFDCTISMIAHHFYDNNDDYKNAISEMKIEEPKNEFDFLFSNKILEEQTIGGTIKNNAGRVIQESPIISKKEDLDKVFNTIDINNLSNLYNKMTDKVTDNVKKNNELNKMLDEGQLFTNEDNKSMINHF